MLCLMKKLSNRSTVVLARGSVDICSRSGTFFFLVDFKLPLYH